ncbi:MAG: hypothetical protein ACE5JD_09105 [Candidatus Methylomirabilia bacterium]
MRIGLRGILTLVGLLLASHFVNPAFSLAGIRNSESRVGPECRLQLYCIGPLDALALLAI